MSDEAKECIGPILERFGGAAFAYAAADVGVSSACSLFLWRAPERTSK